MLRKASPKYLKGGALWFLRDKIGVAIEQLTTTKKVFFCVSP
jgi:hypothetical protein